MKKFWILLLLIGLMFVSLTEIQPELTIIAGISIISISVLPPLWRVIETKQWCRLLIDDMERIFYTRSGNWRYSLAPIRARGPTFVKTWINDKISRMFQGLPCQGKENSDKCQEADNRKIGDFINRLKKLGINVELVANYPWIYLDKINGKKVTERFRAEWGFTVAFAPIRRDQPLHFTDTKEIFKLIRKYLNSENV